ncbi:myosin light chain 5 isoform X1 [Macaca mulatta]
MASRKTKKKEGGALRAQRASSNVFSNFEQTQIQEFKEAFTLMDQNRDGFIDKEDLKDTYASLGKTNVKDDELDAMLKEASGPINFTMFLNMFGEKLSGTDAEETILNAFKMLDPDGKGKINKEYIKRLLMSQADKMTADEVWPAAPLPSPRGEGGAPGVSWLEAHAEPEGLQRRGSDPGQNRPPGGLPKCPFEGQN